ncbi:MAG: N-formylglutamate amidohydrolase [Alphaproteobacteria bacterium ADurb.Bin438]|nr:MAG: N-formylglutamate amidohydrolase [Alphaproteobacteria bacterium ADurb.Bin438]
MLKDMDSYYIFNENGKNKNIDLPKEYGNLGLDEADLSSTITSDKGIKEVSMHLAKKLDCVLFLNKYSRILIDLNRSITNTTLIKNFSHTTKIPGNQNVDDAEFLKRINEYYRPYRFAIDDKVNEYNNPYILSLHSFTPHPRFMKNPRKQHVCVAFVKENEFSKHILTNLEKDENIVIGINKPFNLSRPDKNGNGVAYVYGHKGLNSVLFEIKNDLISNDNEQKEWSKKLYDLIPYKVKQLYL